MHVETAEWSNCGITSEFPMPQTTSACPRTPSATGKATGKIVAHRHPVNGYRLFRREELDALLKKVERSRPRKLRD